MQLSNKVKVSLRGERVQPEQIVFLECDFEIDQWIFGSILLKFNEVGNCIPVRFVGATDVYRRITRFGSSMFQCFWRFQF
ncbi:hypothetical protein RB195_026088 [Necator americanus]|uniref:Uncharacterized protein n=1 Tax=Necator americanus TaxID=51031 RepID=A0ABR1EVD6_NECAM